MEREIEQAWSLVAGATRIVALTGAGISTASGIPDFRGPEGVWTKDPDAEMLSSYDVFVGSRDVRTRAWRSRLESPMWASPPNAGHLALVELERRGVLEGVITQNIDRLHHQAGHDPARVIEIHGNAHEAVCLRCGHRQPIEEVLDRVAAGDDDPACIEVIDGAPCQGIIKSATISFGQSLVAADLARAELLAQECDLLLAIGSTLSVYPIAGVVPIAVAHGAPVIIINLEPTAMDDLATVVLRSEISTALAALIASR